MTTALKHFSILAAITFAVALISCSKAGTATAANTIAVDGPPFRPLATRGRVLRIHDHSNERTATSDAVNYRHLEEHEV